MGGSLPSLEMNVSLHHRINISAISTRDGVVVKLAHIALGSHLSRQPPRATVGASRYGRPQPATKPWHPLNRRRAVEFNWPQPCVNLIIQVLPQPW